jgi:hypothetical protein
MPGPATYTPSIKLIEKTPGMFSLKSKTDFGSSKNNK